MASVTLDLEEYEKLKKENDSLKKENKELKMKLDNFDKAFYKILLGNSEEKGLKIYMIDLSTIETVLVPDMQVPTIKHCYIKYDINTTKMIEDLLW